MLIHEPVVEIANAHRRWIRNRAFLTGEDAVKYGSISSGLTGRVGGEHYLPRLPGMTDAEYQKYLFRTPFFAGAARIKEGLKGLIFRKPPTLTVADSVKNVFETITPYGHTFNDLCEDVIEETLITGFTGLLIDYPEMVTGLSLEDAVANGQRPFIAVYQAEQLLEVTPAVVGNVQKIVHVRMFEDDFTIRQLVLNMDSGRPVYQVTMHRKDEGSGQWLPDDPITPLKNGQPLDSIPFVLVTDKARTFYPTKAPLDDVVNANQHCYLEGADAKNSRFYSSAPILTITGAQPITNLVITPGTVLQFPDSSVEKPVKVDFTEFKGQGQAALEKAYETLKEEMALIGLRMLGSDPKGIEAADTLAIRRASENSILAAFARRVSDRLEEAVDWVLWWMDVADDDTDQEDKSVNLNVDFTPHQMDAKEMEVWITSFTAGVFSFETLCERLINGDKLPEDFDIDAEKKAVEADSLAGDRPQALPISMNAPMQAKDDTVNGVQPPTPTAGPTTS